MAVGAGDVLLVTFVGELLGQTIMTTFHYGVDAVTGTPTQNAFGTEVFAKTETAAGMADKYRGCLPPNYQHVETWVQFILDVRFRKQIFATGDPGTFGLDTQASNTAAVISRFGAAANKYNLGSVHLPATTDGGLDEGQIDGALLTELNLFAPYLYNPLVLATLGTIQPILISGNSKLNAKPIIGATVQTTGRVMRRRTKGVGI